MFPPKYWTYGAEHELGNWDRRRGVPDGFIADRKDVTVMNSNGIAADPKGRTYDFGGEINTPPTDSPQGQVQALQTIKTFHPEVVINHRSNLHIHIHVPALRENIDALKRIARYNIMNLPHIFRCVEPIPMPLRITYSNYTEYNGAMRRYKRRLRSHHTTLSKSRIEKQLAANTTTEFFAAEVPLSKGKPQWHLGIRTAINLRQLQETDTIEFRHFPGTLNDEELLTCVEWCRDYLNAALHTNEQANSLYQRQYKNRRFPKFPEYVHMLEERYRATCHDGTLRREEIELNIKSILGNP